MTETETETPTRPETADPLLPVFARIEHKIDTLTDKTNTLTSMVKAFYDELNEQRARLNGIDERLSMELDDGE